MKKQKVLTFPLFPVPCAGMVFNLATPVVKQISALRSLLKDLVKELSTFKFWSYMYLNVGSFKYFTKMLIKSFDFTDICC